MAIIGAIARAIRIKIKKAFIISLRSIKGDTFDGFDQRLRFLRMIKVKIIRTTSEMIVDTSETETYRHGSRNKLLYLEAYEIISKSIKRPMPKMIYFIGQGDSDNLSDERKGLIVC